MFCIKCGNQLAPGTTFCSKCGTQQTQGSQPGQQAPPQQAPYQQAPPQQAPYQQAPPQQAPYQQAPYQRPPYQQPAYGAPPANLGNFVFTGANKTIKAYLFPLLFFVGNAIVSIILLLTVGITRYNFGWFGSTSSMNAVGYIFLVLCILEFAGAGYNFFVIFRSRISVYDNGIQGIATKKISTVLHLHNLPFTLPYNQISNAFVKDEELTVVSGGVTYSIFTASAAQIQATIAQRCGYR